jgi:uncharacterized iron-regulated protein
MRAAAVWLLLAGMAAAGPVSDMTRLPAADVVILGEIHDNPQHHRNQAAGVAAVQPRALVFEMLTPAQAGLVTVDNRADPALGVLLGWEKSGWPDFAMYQPILTAAPMAAVFGAAVPGEALMAGRDPAAIAALMPDTRFGLTDSLAQADQTEREAEQMAAHCDALPVDLLPYMVAVQRLRDATLAARALDAFEATGGPVVVITGTGHARRDQGVPAALALAAPDLRVLSVGQLEQDPGLDAPYDLWVVTDPAPRPDPCGAFGAGN